jgi:L-fuculose-phosphate aldolase
MSIVPGLREVHKMDKVVEAILDCGKQLSSQGIEEASGGGISCRLVNGGYAASISGASFKELKEDDVERGSNGDNNLLSFIYDRFPHINAIIISSSMDVMKASREGKSILAALDDMAQIIGYDALILPDKDKKKIAKALKKRYGCIIRDVGMVTIGRSLEEAYTAALVLDKASRVLNYAPRIGGVKPVGRLSYLVEHTIYQKKYSKINGQFLNKKKDSYGELEFKELKQQIVDCGRLLVKEGLVQGTWGNIAARVDETYMLVTPSGIDYDILEPEDIVKVNMYTLEYEGSLKPTSEKSLHAAILRERKEIGAVIHTHSPWCSVVAASRVKFLPVISEDMVEQVLGAVKVTEHVLPTTKKQAQAAMEAMRDRNACLLGNHGVICCGQDLAKAFETCRVMETAAERYIKREN